MEIFIIYFKEAQVFKNISCHFGFSIEVEPIEKRRREKRRGGEKRKEEKRRRRQRHLRLHSPPATAYQNRIKRSMHRIQRVWWLFCFIRLFLTYRLVLFSFLTQLGERGRYFILSLSLLFSAFPMGWDGRIRQSYSCNLSAWVSQIGIYTLVVSLQRFHYLLFVASIH